MAYYEHVSQQVPRLRFIAAHCPALRAEACRLCLKAMEGSHDLRAHREVAKALREIHAPGAPPDDLPTEQYAVAHPCSGPALCVCVLACLCACVLVCLRACVHGYLYAYVHSYVSICLFVLCVLVLDCECLWLIVQVYYVFVCAWLRVCACGGVEKGWKKTLA